MILTVMTLSITIKRYNHNNDSQHNDIKYWVSRLNKIVILSVIMLGAVMINVVAPLWGALIIIESTKLVRFPFVKITTIV
jgi:hypothetical protein